MTFLFLTLSFRLSVIQKGRRRYCLVYICMERPTDDCSNQVGTSSGLAPMILSSLTLSFGLSVSQKGRRRYCPGYICMERSTNDCSTHSMDDCSTHYPKSTSCHLSFPFWLSVIQGLPICVRGLVYSNVHWNTMKILPTSSMLLSIPLDFLPTG